MAAYEAYPKFGTILCAIEPLQITPKVREQIEEDGYQLKENPHITVVNSEFGGLLIPDKFEELAVFFQKCPPPKYTILYEIEWKGVRRRK